MKLKFLDFSKFFTAAAIISATVILIGIVFFIVRGGFKASIDFTGGVMVHFKTAPDLTQKELREALSAEGLKVQIQNIGRPEAHEYIVKTAAVSKNNTETVQKIEDILVKRFQDKVFLPFLQTDVVGPTIGKYITQQAFWLVLLSFLCIMIYISIRFKPIYAFGGVLALIHDVAVMLAAVVITGREISTLIIAAILTIIGYSINDTIVVFDRIREDLKKYRDMTFTDVMNKAVNETLSRTIITSLTTLFSVLAILFFGGEVLKDFAFTLSVGIIAGTYSSVFIAGSLVNLWYSKREKNKNFVS